MKALLPFHLFHAAQLVHCPLVMLHAVFRKLQVSGILQNATRSQLAFTRKPKKKKRLKSAVVT